MFLNDNTRQFQCKAKKTKLEKLDEVLIVSLVPKDNVAHCQSELFNKNSSQLPDGDPNFNARQGWLNRWKKRYGVCQLTVKGEHFVWKL